MDNVDEVTAYKNENGTFDVIMFFMHDGQPAKIAWKDMHLSIEQESDYGGPVKLKLVFES